MCLAIPATIAKMEPNNMATIDITGVQRVVSLDLLPDAVVGDWVLVHAGFAIQVIDEETARETLQLLSEIPFFGEEPLIASGE